MLTGSYVSYMVVSKSSLPGWAGCEVSVRRRFRDFVSLADIIKVRNLCVLFGIVCV